MVRGIRRSGPYLSTSQDMHLGWQIGNAARGYTPNEGCSTPARRLRAPRSPPLSFFATLSASPFRPSSLSRSLARSISFFPLRLSYPSLLSFRRAPPACSQFVSRVCAHTPYSGTAAASNSVRPPCPTLPSVGSGPRENSYVVSSCRVTPSRR